VGSTPSRDIHRSKYRDPANYPTPDDRHSLTLIAEPTVSYEKIVRTLDVLREIPRSATIPTIKHHIPAVGCALKLDPAKHH
jgi:hypothetical protein